MNPFNLNKILNYRFSGLLILSFTKIILGGVDHPTEICHITSPFLYVQLRRANGNESIVYVVRL